VKPVIAISTFPANRACFGCAFVRLASGGFGRGAHHSSDKGA